MRKTSSCCIARDLGSILKEGLWLLSFSFWLTPPKTSTLQHVSTLTRQHFNTSTLPRVNTSKMSPLRGFPNNDYSVSIIMSPLRGCQPALPVNFSTLTFPHFHTLPRQHFRTSTHQKCHPFGVAFPHYLSTSTLPHFRTSTLQHFNTSTLTPPYP